MSLSDHDEDTTPTEKTSLWSHSSRSTRSENEQLPHRDPRSRSQFHSKVQSYITPLARNTSNTRGINATDLASGGESDNKVPSLWSSSKSQLLVLAALCFGDVLAFMCLSIMAPFFPQEAERKEMSSTVSGWVFGIYSLIQCGFAPVVGKLIPVVGSRFLLLSGLVFGGGCTILFGLMDRVPVTEDNNWTFTLFCFILRISLALGNTAATTAIFVIGTSSFPDNASTALGLLETSSGLGLVLGPALGGVLYQVGGFLAPFAALGGTMTVSVLLFYFILPKNNGNGAAEKPGSILALLKVPVIDLILVTNIVSALFWVGLDPILEPNLRQFTMSPSEVGLVFLLIAATYAILAPISGWIADRIENSTPLLIIGFAILTVGFLLLVPLDLIGLGSYKKMWLTLVSLVLVGAGSSLTIVPTYDKIQTAARKAGIPESIGMHGVVAGLLTSAYAFGEFIGPIFSGAAYDAIGFGWTMTVIAAIAFSMFLLMICIYLYEKGLCGRINDKGCCSTRLEDGEKSSTV